MSTQRGPKENKTTQVIGCKSVNPGLLPTQSKLSLSPLPFPLPLLLRTLILDFILICLLALCLETISAAELYLLNIMSFLLTFLFFQFQSNTTE